jgi:hypothetical protein
MVLPSSEVSDSSVQGNLPLRISFKLLSGSGATLLKFNKEFSRPVFSLDIFLRILFRCFDESIKVIYDYETVRIWNTKYGRNINDLQNAVVDLIRLLQDDPKTRCVTIQYLKGTTKVLPYSFVYKSHRPP